MSSNQCPVCDESLQPQATQNNHSWVLYNCSNCGAYRLTAECSADISAHLKNPLDKAKLSYAIRRMRKNNEPPIISYDLAESILKNTNLPIASEQIENLILYLGQSLLEPGEKVPLEPSALRATLGSLTTNGAAWVLKEAFNLGFVRGAEMIAMNTPYALLNATLTIQGWEKFKGLQATTSGSTRAFMAMKFGDSQLDNVFVEFFKPAAKRAGFGGRPKGSVSAKYSAVSGAEPRARRARPSNDRG